MSKVSVKLTRALKDITKIREAFNSSVARLIGGLIDAEIGKGLSPVAGQGRFADYKPSYKGAIKSGPVRGTDGTMSSAKRLRPVNLSVSGSMRKSQKVTEKGDAVSVRYESKYAAYHNEANGTPYPRRAMLPTRPGEKFSRTIDRQVFDIAKKSVAKILAQ